MRVVFVIYIGYYHGALFEEAYQGEALFPQILKMFYSGALHDNRVISIFGILYFVLGFLGICITSFKNEKSVFLSFVDYFAYGIFGLFLFVSIANFTYYTIYKDVFNIIILGLFFDDQQAIFEDGLSGKYWLSIKFLSFFIALWLCIWIYKKIIKKINFAPNMPKVLLYDGVLVLVYGIWMLGYMNSSISFYNRSLDQELEPARNAFLRKMTPSPFRSLYLVYRGYKSEQSANFSSFTSKAPQEATKEFFSLDKDGSYDFRVLLAQASSKPSDTPKIKHIFWIIAESLGTYAFSPDYDDIGLVSGMKSLIDNKHGFLVKNFFENAHGTIWSIESQLTGLYYTGVRLSFRAASFKPFLTAPADNLKRAGYKTMFYYGGSEVWQNLLEFSKSQGFDESYGLSSYEAFAIQQKAMKPYKNVWGIWDNILLDFVAQNAARSEQPTFNMLLTTSFHGPTDLPWEYIEAIGGKKENFEKFLEKTKKENWDAKELGILWWDDKHITRFIKEFSELYPDSLFIITGDHTHYSHVSGFQDSREVPMLLYSKALEPKMIAEAGSQIDILPSIINLVAQEGFIYYSFGKPLFTLNPKERENPERIFVAHELIGNSKKVYSIHNTVIDLQTRESQIAEGPLMHSFIEKMKDAKALSWWIANKGNIIPSK
ncbi:LTA synthase family protein [Helicobacter kayseriensis]|uniref:LTA synthase family protein n=1 Tax=Helicobacter kayseriensis TaxID=2905877 RepID=UPI001E56E4A7|nr:LTA synthase family protein [Helicobacter kayseriensis]MCE3047320.1 LTA synthase family protein [Helicobacter kayseriensis]MCE3048691.1 LTA synthase family protein [Helicobacter kayseriensis]